MTLISEVVPLGNLDNRPTQVGQGALEPRLEVMRPVGYTALRKRQREASAQAGLLDGPRQVGLHVRPSVDVVGTIFHAVLDRGGGTTDDHDVEWSFERRVHGFEEEEADQLVA